jgi:hypothetical protein
VPSDYSPDVTSVNIIAPAFLQASVSVSVSGSCSLSTVAHATVEWRRMAEAAGLFSLVRTGVQRAGPALAVDH